MYTASQDTVSRVSNLLFNAVSIVRDPWRVFAYQPSTTCANGTGKAGAKRAFSETLLWFTDQIRRFTLIGGRRMRRNTAHASS